MKFFGSCSGARSLSSSFCSGRAFPHPFGRGAPCFFGVLRGFRRMFAVPAVSVVGSAVRVVRSVRPVCRPRVRIDGRVRASHREDSDPPFGAAQRASGAGGTPEPAEISRGRADQRRNASTSLRNGAEACAPALVTERAAALAAKRTAPSRSRPSAKAVATPALNTSPAAVVSTAATR